MSLTSAPFRNDKVVVLDSWPFVESILRNVRGPRLDALLEQAAQSKKILLMSEMNLGEVFYLVAKHKGDITRAETAIETISRLPIQVVPVVGGLALRAAQIKAQHQLSYADCFCALLAIEHSAAILTGDPDFRKLEAKGVLRVDWVGR